MTNSGDQPLAPREPYETPTQNAGRPPRGVMGARYGGASASRDATGSAPSAPSAPSAAAPPAPVRPVQPVRIQPANSPGSAPPAEVQASSSTATVAPAARATQKATAAAAKDKQREASRRPRAVRRAKLRLVRLDPWSVTKVTFLLSIAFGVMCAVAVFLIFSIMDASGLWDNVNSTIQSLVKQKGDDKFDINKYVGISRVMGITMLIAAVNVVLLTALATLGAFIYNMAASLLGGVEVTLAEDLP